jgi:hypothetical protein
MGLEPMTSPLPRECSTTELHQLSSTSSTLPLLDRDRDRIRVSTTRNAKKPSSTQLNSWNLPGSIVRHTSTARTASTTSATTNRPSPEGAISISTLACLTCNFQLTTKNRKSGAQGRIRTSVTRRVADLQSAAINRSATCALRCLRPPASLHPVHASTHAKSSQTLLRLWMANTAGWNFKQVQPTSATTNSSCCPNIPGCPRILELAKGFEPPTA